MVRNLPALNETLASLSPLFTRMYLQGRLKEQDEIIRMVMRFIEGNPEGLSSGSIGESRTPPSLQAPQPTQHREVHSLAVKAFERTQQLIIAHKKKPEGSELLK